MDGTIKSDIQSVDCGGSERVSLYTIDMRAYDGGIARIAPGPVDGRNIYFGGEVYVPLPIKVEGMSWAGDGKMPRPTVSLSNVSLALHAQVISMGDLIGCKFQRIRTFKKYLDTETTANSTAMFPPDIYEINRKLKHNKSYLQFELKSPLDIEGKFLPKRQVLPFCQHVYRTWYDGDFTYVGSTCPYTDTDYFDENGSPTTAENDKCGKTMYDCQLRFPSSNNDETELPMRGFPGVGRFGKVYRG